jgi:hypothetical protein
MRDGGKRSDGLAVRRELEEPRISVRRRSARVSVGDIGRGAWVVDESAHRLHLGRVALAFLLAPLSALMGFVLLCGVGSRARLRRYFSAHPRSAVHAKDDEVLDIEILQFSAHRAWWLRDGQGRAAALVLDVGSDEVVLIGGGWPRVWNDAQALHARWIVWRRSDDQRTLSIRAWGRRVPVRNVDGEVGCQDLEGKALTRTVAELYANLSRLVRPFGLYR